MMEKIFAASLTSNQISHPAVYENGPEFVTGPYRGEWDQEQLSLLKADEAKIDSDSLNPTADPLSDEELLKFIRDIPLKKGYKNVADELIMPMTVTEVWENFFSDGAQFDMD